jgi:hypothetical protein
VRQEDGVVTKRTIMLLGLAGVFLAGTACFGLFTSRGEPSRDAEVAECAGLSGQARADCEQRHRK